MNERTKKNWVYVPTIPITHRPLISARKHPLTIHRSLPLRVSSQKRRSCAPSTIQDQQHALRIAPSCSYLQPDAESSNHGYAQTHTVQSPSRDRRCSALLSARRAARAALAGRTGAGTAARGASRLLLHLVRLADGGHLRLGIDLPDIAREGRARRRRKRRVVVGSLHATRGQCRPSAAEVGELGRHGCRCARARVAVWRGTWDGLLVLVKRQRAHMDLPGEAGSTLAP